MRLIDANNLFICGVDDLTKGDRDALIDHKFLYVPKKFIDEAPTVEYIGGYRIDELIFIAGIMAEEGITPRQVTELLSDTRRIVQMLVDEITKKQAEVFAELMEGGQV